MIEIEPARASDRPAIEALLRANALPTAGIELALGTAVVAREEGRIVGCAAIEPHGSAGLLRSVCVELGRRGFGLGRLLVERAETARAALSGSPEFTGACSAGAALLRKRLSPETPAG